MQDVVNVLYRSEDIRQRIREIGHTITEDYENRKPVLVSVLKGSSIFLADLVREIDLPLTVDFMSISAYGGAAEKSGVVRILKDLDQDVGERDVLIVEDIIDTGLTASYLISVLEARDPRSVEFVTLLDKSVRRITPLPIRYSGFDCPDRFVIGYGLDFEERYRNLPFILSVEDYPGLIERPEVLEGFLLEGEPPADLSE
ncbi:MAG: hypoxanthine phosphoribosyltransferase [Actinomycetota bacterium]